MIRQELSDSNSYSGQQTCILKLLGESAIQTTVVTTGLIAVALPLDKTRIQGFATRFGSTFDEYRILSCILKIRSLNVSSGVSRFWFDEKSNATPSSTDASERVGLTIPNNSSNGRTVTSMTWKARDLLDLQYTAIGTTATPAYFKIYTSNAGYSSPIAVTDLWLIEYHMVFEFRGLQAA